MAKCLIQRIVGVVLVVAAAAWVAALGGFASGFVSDDPPTVNPYASGPTTEPGPVITIVGFAFGGAASVAVGQTLTVSNQDTVAHTWSAADGSFTSGSISPGGSFTWVFEQTGTYNYFCRFHDAMTGSITVTP